MIIAGHMVVHEGGLILKNQLDLHFFQFLICDVLQISLEPKWPISFLRAKILYRITVGIFVERADKIILHVIFVRLPS